MDKDVNIRIFNFHNNEYKFLQNSSLGHGGSIWDGALVLAKYFEKNFDKLNDLYKFKDKHILELGTGTGICGICFSEFNPKLICITDLKELKSLVMDNLQRNKHLIKSEIIFEELIWGYNDQEHFEKIWNAVNGFDILIGSDLIDSSGKYIQDLIETLLLCFARNPKLIIFNCYTIHKKATVERFKEILKKENLDFEEIEEKNMDDEYRSDDIGIMVIRKKS